MSRNHLGSHKTFRQTKPRVSSLLYDGRKTGICPLCGASVQMVQDHDHKTGKTRGYICAACNCGLGFFRDNPLVMLRAAFYLQRRKGRNSFIYKGLQTLLDKLLGNRSLK